VHERGCAVNDYAALAAELAASPGLIEALLAEHTDDGSGHCRACTTGGTGTHAVPMPCSLRQLADYAAAARTRRSPR
jgi:hypothetical protein